jgi:hypothetical protein
MLCQNFADSIGRVLARVAFAASALIVASPARAEVISLAPSSEWVVSFDDASCAMIREFGTPESRVSMELRQFRPGGSFQLVVQTVAFARRNGPVSFTILPDEAQEFEYAIGVNRADGARGFALLGSFKRAADREIAERLQEDDQPPRDWPIDDQLIREREISGILVEQGFSEEFLLQTGRLDQVMNVMRTCMDDLVASWGVDVVAHRTLERQVRPIDVTRWRRHLDRRYPLSMVARGQQAIVWARVTVGTDGRAMGCAIQSTMSDATFNDVACSLLVEHGRWEPALDARHQPIISYWVGAISYAIP